MKTSPYRLLSRDQGLQIGLLVKENPKIHFQNIHVNVDND